MAKRYGLLAVPLFVCLVLCASSAGAHWVKNGAPVCTVSSWQVSPKVITDQNGGAIIVWNDRRNGYDVDIYGNRIDPNGNVLGPSTGVPVCTAAGDQWNQCLIPDGTGGAIIAWEDGRNGGNFDIYAQRVDGTGTARWVPDGIGICTGGFAASGVKIVPDGGTGAIIVWHDYRSGSSYDIWAQRVDADGNTLWAANGIGVCTEGSDQFSPLAVPDGSGGAIIIWSDQRDADNDIYAQRIDADGNLLWAADGVPVCTATGEQSNLQMTSAVGGAIIAWQDYRSGNSDAYAQKIDTDGNPIWTVDGMPLCVGGTEKNWPQLVPDLGGGAIIVWNDYRNDSRAPYAQHLGLNGDMLWDSYGKQVFPEGGGSLTSMLPDGEGGAIITIDPSYDAAAWPDIYAQRIDSDGNLLWVVPRGVAVCNAPFSQVNPVLASDGRGGAIAAWEDWRSGNLSLESSDIFCQRVSADGMWGAPEPAIVSCLDLPGDQGGWVRLVARASSHDIASEKDYPILGYNVWRRIAQSGVKVSSPRSLAAPAAERARLLDLFANPSKLAGVKLSGGQAQFLGFPPGDWESVAFQFATRDSVYKIAAPTRDDSTASGTPEEVFLVTAHASVAGVFATSAPDSGYSVDNLAPGPTALFAGVETVSPHGVQLSWAPNDASDIGAYDIYRGDDGSFVPDESNLFGTTADLALFDGTWTRAGHYFYKLVAVDRHGNRGPAALLTPVDVKVGTMLQSFTASLVQSAIEISWKVSGSGTGMQFFVLRSEAAGGAFGELASPEISQEGLSFSMSDRSCQPGTSYRYRIDVKDEAGRRTLFETDAISMPALPLTLYQNHPNPFNPATAITYYLPDASQVTLDVYDSSGRLVAKLLDRDRQPKGAHTVEWRGLDGQGRSVSSGVYFYRLTSGKETISKKMVLLR